MKEIKLKTWIIWAVILFSVGLLADYFFWHLILGGRNQASEVIENSIPTTIPFSENAPQEEPVSIINDPVVEEKIVAEAHRDNFLESLQKCAPEIAAQAIATPEALMAYLKKSIGIENEDIIIENYHITLKDGSLRRIHIVAADDSNSPSKKEIKLFKLDEEGYPERIATEPTETLESLLAQGSISRHEVRSVLTLKDNSSVNMELHDEKVFEFQFNNHGKILSCRYTSCYCP